ncbi:MAG: hypothetical protein ABFE13_01520 [Phycisphaerales bacterium]
MSEEQGTALQVPESSPQTATAESILAFRNRPPIEHHDLPDCRRVYVYGLTDLEVQEWYADCGKTKDDEGREKVDDRFGDAKLLIRCIRDAEGKRLFTTAHLPQLVELPNFVKAPLVNKAMKLSAIGGKADAEILKNYARTLAGGC